MPGPAWLGAVRQYSGKEVPSWLRLFVGAISGAALSLSFTGSYLTVYSWVCVGLLLIALFDARPRVAFGCGFLHALLFVFTSVPWIAVVLSVHGGLSRAGGWGVLLLIAAAWGVLVGTFAWIVNRLSQRSTVLACLGAPFLWVTFEFVRAHLPEISFPWNLLGYPASNNLGLVQVTSITGIYGLSFLVMAGNALLAWGGTASAPTLKSRTTVLAVAAALIIAIMLEGSRAVPLPPASHTVRAVQPNFPEVPSYEANWFSAHASDLEQIERLSLAPTGNHPDLLVWPEAPAPFSFQDAQFATLASKLAIQFQHPFVVGVVEWKRPADSSRPGGFAGFAPYNSALLIDGQGQRVFGYDKIHLVPFGEYEPFPLIHRVVTSVSGEVGGFRKGTSYSIAPLPGGHSFGVFICYEAIYAGEIRHFAENGAQLFINISNDGWFGHSAAAEQHLRMARVRAVENHRWIVRVTNSGITASIDPYGRILRGLPKDVRASVDLPYDFRTDKTLYTRFGDWFAWLCVLVSAILLASTFRKAV
jgi:apolipoprotein N-acyltransferase